jgi:hypothetical protein
MFSVNERVICVDASLPANPWHRQHPLIGGRVYTVIQSGPPDTKEPCISIDTSGRMWECHRFRPLRKSKTDIEFAHKILRKATKKVSAH